MIPTQKPFLVVVAFLAFSAGMMGCGGTAMTKVSKPALPEHIKSIAIPLIVNKSLKYGIEADFTDTIIREFQKDGRLKIVSEAEADAILMVTVEHYIKEPAQYDVNNVPILYNLKMHVSLQLLNAKTHEVLKSVGRVGGFTGGTVSFAVSPQTGLDVITETEAQRQAFEKFARDIVNLLIYGWENI